ncbi:MAG: hypothetical protein K2K28_00890, partial [Clostridia bacterium]|nr:hypothetical protein [Clostridia bacterium]
MIKVCALQNNKLEEFKALFKNYYDELDCGEDIDHLLNEYVLADYLAGLIKIDLLSEDETAVGFAIYQIDDIDNEWNLKEGWGN